MKKVLLSIVASTLLFNTIYAEELEVLENNEDVTQEVEETINNEKEIVNNESTKETVFTSSEEVKTYVAQIGDTKYETFMKPLMPQKMVTRYLYLKIQQVKESTQTKILLLMVMAKY